ncbi:hypothetical protein Cabys_3495 [Caldithrix abyssi DSM 13497]|uniref:Uncharacterized protein n=1 Tax=Caldithrix abyssi DSM 13497 TaxID=880073 RepID=A0A1J1CDD1_CALAY|nr:hypothetical protein Cabys_3495 [Caldithrix abyssi DSM 13497]
MHYSKASKMACGSISIPPALSYFYFSRHLYAYNVVLKQLNRKAGAEILSSWLISLIMGCFFSGLKKQTSTPYLYNSGRLI